MFVCVLAGSVNHQEDKLAAFVSIHVLMILSFFFFNAADGKQLGDMQSILCHCVDSVLNNCDVNELRQVFRKF